MGIHRCQRGQSSAEYAGVCAFVAALVAIVLLAGPGIGSSIVEGVGRALCRATGECGSSGKAKGGAATGAHASGEARSDPFESRYAANRLAMERAIPEVEAEIAAVDAAIEEIEDSSWPIPPELIPDFFPGTNLRELERERAFLVAKLDFLRAAASSDRNFLLFEPAGDGMVAEVLGDLASAEHIVVVVPGVGNDITNFDRGPLNDARALQTTVDQMTGGDTAYVAWLGYDTPEGVNLDAARSGRAERGAVDLPGFVTSLDPDGGAQVTAICHSYGSVVCGRAASKGLGADDIVFIGSPGVDADNVEELATPARVWAGRTDDDPIRFSPNTRILDTGHGEEPVDEEFGARVFETGVASGHSEYYKLNTESLRNLARILLGRFDEVTCSREGCND